MTADDLWEDYRRRCCPPELGETTREIALQREAFLCGVTATIGNIIMRPECFDVLRKSIADWIAKKRAGRN